jgi:hypothetical protein
MNLLLALALALAQPAAASSLPGVTPAQQGWWTAANPGSPLPPVPAPPDVPSGDLLLEGGSSAAQPVAISALVYFLPPDSGVQSLALNVAPASLSTPGAPIELCPLDGDSIVAEQGGPMSDAPAYDCRRSVTAKPTGSTYRLDVSSLASGGALAVALLTTGPADRIVLAKPFLLQVAPDVSAPTFTVGSLPSGSPPNPSTSASAPLPSSAPSPPVPAVAGSGIRAATSDGPPVVAPQLAPAPSAATTVPSEPGVSEPAVALAGSVKSSSSGARAFATGAAVLAIVTALSLWMMAGRRSAGSRSGTHLEDHLADGPPVGDMA